ncbi:hypothetical protein [Asanoa sp. NPDC050611]|uniref:hypothetical protein n=1 Tax=Asanoa sp. NPDC050611 TaxID=3157098 RepID=UPI0033FDB31C
MPIALAAGIAAVVIATGPAADSSSTEAMIPAACFDGFNLWNYYHDSGDSATASALLSNLYGMGCFD